MNGKFVYVITLKRVTLPAQVPTYCLHFLGCHAHSGKLHFWDCLQGCPSECIITEGLEKFPLFWEGGRSGYSYIIVHLGKLGKTYQKGQVMD